jgi:hypothetical protein
MADFTRDREQQKNEELQSRPPAEETILAESYHLQSKIAVAL